MTQMPNWFRWLIIVIATLIMCACRAPIQNGQSAPQSVLINSQPYAPSQSADIPRDLFANNRGQHEAHAPQLLGGASGAPRHTQAGATTPGRDVALALAALNEPRADQNQASVQSGVRMNAHPAARNTAQSRRTEQRSRIIELLNGQPETKQTTVAAIRPPIAVTQQSAPTLAATQTLKTRQRFAPVVKNTDAGVRIQEIQAMVPEVDSAQASSNQTALGRGDALSRAVYLRMNDEANSDDAGRSNGILATGAQLDAEVGSNLGSQVGTAEVITPSAAPMAPIVSSEFANGVSAQHATNDASSVLVPNAASSEVAPHSVTNSTEWSGAPVVDSPNHMMSTGQPVIVQPYGQPSYGEPVHGQPVYGEPVYGQPINTAPTYEQPLLADDAVLSLDEAPHSFSSGPYEEYLPVEEVPVEVMPERWADDPYAAGQNIAERELSRRYPDEYICDGGDANGQVFVMNDWRLRNLDPEDTIGHYDTKAGEVVVEASNRVCVYAPRFAAARQVTSPFQNEKHEQLLVAARGTKAFLEQIDSGTNQLDSTLSPKRHVLMQPPSSFRQKTAGVEGIQRRAVKIAAYDVSAHEDFRVMKLGIHKQSEEARLSEFTAKAVNWTSDKAVQILVDEEVAKTNVSRRGAETFFTIGDNGPAKLRVIKTASRADALPGEEVEFTLRFDNVGYQTIGNVTVVDNLTTRLEFIDDSDLCSEDCQFLTDANDAESLTLRWEIKDPIEPGEGGLIRFRCRVR